MFSKTYAIVTGTSRGIGEAIASGLLRSGASVLGIARSEAAATLAEHALYHHAQLDLTRVESATNWFEQEWKDERAASCEQLLLINNAGQLGGNRSIEHTRASELSDAMTVNATVPIWLMGFALRQERPKTTIVNISSGAATSPYPGWGSYCPGKAALEMAGQVLAEELKELPALQDRHIHILSYSPGVVATAMQAEIRAADQADFPRLERFVALHRDGDLASPEAPANHLLSLVADEAAPPYRVMRYTAE